MANVPTTAWDETSPAGSDNISQGDNKIRELKTQIREVINVDHDFPSSGQDTDVGQHKKVTLQEQDDLGTGDVGATILGSQTVGGKGELVYTDEDDNDIQLTSGGSIGSATTDIIGNDCDLDGAIHADDISIDTNDTYITSKDAAGTGTVDLIKANSSDIPVIPDGAQLATSGAPTEDAGIANKKYVDDKVQDMPDGLSRAAVTLYGNGAYSSNNGQYSYLSIGKNSSGQLVMASGVANSGVAVPLPADCDAADCHWIVAPMAINASETAIGGWECSIDASRVVTVRCRSNNWVS